MAPLAVIAFPQTFVLSMQGCRTQEHEQQKLSSSVPSPSTPVGFARAPGSSLESRIEIDSQADSFGKCHFSLAHLRWVGRGHRFHVAAGMGEGTFTLEEVLDRDGKLCVAKVMTSEPTLCKARGVRESAA